MGDGAPDRIELARSLFLRARELYEAGDFSLASEAFRDSNQLVPHHVARQLEARCQFKLGRFLEALAICDSLRIERYLPGTEMLRIECLAELERWAEALEAIASWREPSNPKLFDRIRAKADQ